ncbi:biotin--[acetyl-CoA-carboxylase] ligase [Elusimicrobiota bacterium]
MIKKHNIALQPKSPDGLVAGLIQLSKKHYPIGKNIVCYQTIDSTQSLAKELACKTSIEGTAILSETQTKSYGRFGRNWISPAGGVWLSVILRPDISLSQVSKISILTCLSLCLTLERLFGMKPKIKWPNDIIIKDKKAAGMILESSFKANKLDWIVLGIGLDVNNTTTKIMGKNVTSLQKILKYKVNRNKLIKEILIDFNKLYVNMNGKNNAYISKEYLRRSILIGKEIKVNVNGRIYSGKVDNIDVNGELYLNNNGKFKKLTSGTVVSYS